MKKFIFIVFMTLMACGKPPSVTTPPVPYQLLIIDKSNNEYLLKSAPTELDPNSFFVVTDGLAKVDFEKKSEINKITVHTECHSDKSDRLFKTMTKDSVHFIQIWETLPMSFLFDGSDLICNFKILAESSRGSTSFSTSQPRKINSSTLPPLLQFYGSLNSLINNNVPAEVKLKDIKDLKIFEPNGSSGTLKLLCEGFEIENKYQVLDSADAHGLAHQGFQKQKMIPGFKTSQPCYLISFSDQKTNPVLISKKFFLKYEYENISVEIMPTINLQYKQSQRIEILQAKINNPYPFEITMGINKAINQFRFKMFMVHEQKLWASKLMQSAVEYSVDAGSPQKTLETSEHIILNLKPESSVTIKFHAQIFFNQHIPFNNRFHSEEAATGLDFDFLNPLENRSLFFVGLSNHSDEQLDKFERGYAVTAPSLMPKNTGINRMEYFSFFPRGQFAGISADLLRKLPVENVNF